MSPNQTLPFGNHLIYVDESGDHGLAQVDPGYPIFVLAFCLFSKADYRLQACPALKELKFRFWGHDEQVLHEHEIRKPNKDSASCSIQKNGLNSWTRSASWWPKRRSNWWRP